MAKKSFRNILRLTAIPVSATAVLSGAACGSGESDFEQSGTLKALFPNSGITDAEFVDNSTTRLLEEITGQKVEYAQMLGSSEESDVQSALLDGGYSLIKMQRGSYDQNVIQGAFYDITDLIEEYGQNLLATIDESAWDACYYEGKLYAIPEVGFGHMYNNAIVFNMEHLAEVGITEVPSTLTEFTEALHALQDHFGSDPNYHAFSMPGAEAYQPLITGCFEVPYEFYVNEDDEITSWIYSQEADNYLHYMNDLNNYGNGCLSTSWAQATSANVMGFYVQGLCSVSVLPYWNISGTCESMAATGAADSAQDALDNMGFALYLLGDGSYGSVDQTADNSWQLADNTDIGYFCAIPATASEAEAIAAIKWMDAKITDENYRSFLVGKEGESYELVTEEEYLANEADEDSDTVIVPIEEADGTTQYYKLLAEYDNVKDNSMYQTGGNAEVGRRYWPLREAYYNCWGILMDVEDYDHVMTSALSRYSVIPSWSAVSITARSRIVTYIQNTINADDENTFDRYFNYLKDTGFPNLWNDCDADVQAWYQSTKNS